MPPNEWDLFALERLFPGTDPLAEAIRCGLGDAIVVERTLTGVGFFSTVRFSTALPASEQRYWDSTFSHSRLSYGGSLMAWREGDDVLELEGVTFGGEDWPTMFDASEVAGTP
jgi:hypothetical protein